MAMRICLSLCLSSVLAGASLAQTPSPNFDAVTALAQGAIEGSNVLTPIPGFELLLMKDGDVVYDQSFGYWYNGRGVDADSATKPVSASVIMSLTDSSPRPFSLDTRISDYIPAFSGEKQSATIRQAFSHMSGFADSDVLGRADISLYDSALEIAARPSYVPPGFAFIYGGSGMQAAGAVAEIAGNDSWRDLFQQRIAAPLGLTETQYLYAGPENPRIGGGLRTTAGEYATFMEMLRNDGRHDGQQVLSPDAVEEMFTRQTPVDLEFIGSPLNGSADHGVGIWLDERDAQGNLIGAMAGGLRGFTSWIDIDDGIVGVLATDMSYFDNTKDLQYLIRDAVEEAFRDQILPGDTDRNGIVNFADLVILAGNLNQSNKLWTDGDFNGDGLVTLVDYQFWYDNYNPTVEHASTFAMAAAMPIPEPSTWLLLASGLALLPARALLRRRSARHGARVTLGRFQ